MYFFLSSSFVCIMNINIHLTWGAIHRSENDAQMCIYHVSLQSNYGFCCELDDACVQELAGQYISLQVHYDALVCSSHHTQCLYLLQVFPVFYQFVWMKILSPMIKIMEVCLTTFISWVRSFCSTLWIKPLGLVFIDNSVSANLPFWGLVVLSW